MRTVLCNRSYPEAGNLLFEMMEKYISAHEKLILDMSGVDSLPSMFLNNSIGLYLERHGDNSLKGKMIFENITASQVQRLKEYMLRFQNERVN